MVTNLEEMLDQIETVAKEREEVSLAMVLDAVGSRSYGPVLLMTGLVMISPLSGIPGMPSTMGVMVLLISVQLLLHRECCWVPGWVRKRSVGRAKLCKGLGMLRRPARSIDRWIRPRLLPLVHDTGRYAVAAICTLIGASMPIMEPVPFLATTQGAALSVFGLALISRDGLLALIAFSLTAVGLGLLVYRFL